MSTLHDVYHLHLVIVFPSDPAFREMYLCYQEVSRTFGWITVTTEAQFERDKVDCEDNFILFLGKIPPWLPMKTEASIGLQFMGYVVHESRDNERAYRYFMEWSRTSMRADIVFVRDPDQQTRISSFCRNTIHLSNGFYHAGIMGTPHFNESPFPKSLPKKYSVVSYGDDSGRRGPIIQKLKDRLKESYLHVRSVTPDERRKLLSEARTLLHIRASTSDPTYDPFIASEVIASNAMLILESGARWPFEDGGEQCQRVSSLDDGNVDNAIQSIDHYSSPVNARSALSTARHAHIRLSGNFSAKGTIDKILSYARSSIE